MGLIYVDIDNEGNGTGKCIPKGFLLLVRSPYKIERRELIGCTTCAHVIESNAENRPIIQKGTTTEKE